MRKAPAQFYKPQLLLPTATRSDGNDIKQQQRVYIKRKSFVVTQSKQGAADRNF